MNFSTPHMIYIVEAYGVSLCGLFFFFCVTLMQWKKSKKFTAHPFLDINKADNLLSFTLLPREEPNSKA